MKCRYVQLHEICNLIPGFAFKSKDFGCYEDKVIKIADITPPWVKMNGLNGVDLSKYNKAKIQKFIANTGDYVLAMTGATIGKIGRIENGSAYINQRVLLFQPKAETDNDYLFYFINQKSFYDYIIRFVDSETAQPNISATTIGQYQISLPSLDIQRKIGAFLRMFDKKIELNNKINDNLQQQAQALFKSWFVDFEPFGGTCPSNWTQVLLADLTTLISRGVSPKYTENSDQMVINQKCIRNHMIDLSLARKHKPKAITEKWLQFGDLLINSTGAGTLGRTAQVWFNPHNLTVDSHVTIVRPARFELIFYIGLWGIQHEKEIEALHTGSTGQTELPRDRVKALELLLPDDDTLARFNAVVTPMTTTIVANQEQNIRLVQLRDSLLPKLMSGEIDLGGL